MWPLTRRRKLWSAAKLLPSPRQAVTLQDLETERAKTHQALAALQQKEQQLEEYRRKAKRQQAEARHTTLMDTFSHLLPAIDDIARGLNTTPPELRQHPWVEGMFIATQGLASSFEALGLRLFYRISTTSTSFDPQSYEAIESRYRPDVPEGTILRVVRPGYYYLVRENDEIVTQRLLKPAQVIVSTQTKKR